MLVVLEQKVSAGGLIMPATRAKSGINGQFAQRLADLRQKAGYSQKELADEMGITKRKVAYYETDRDHPLASLLLRLAKVLGVSTDELLGIKPIPRKKLPADARLWQRFKKIEKLPSRERRHLVHVIDNFLRGIPKE